MTPLEYFHFLNSLDNMDPQKLDGQYIQLIGNGIIFGR